MFSSLTFFLKNKWLAAVMMGVSGGLFLFSVISLAVAYDNRQDYFGGLAVLVWIIVLFGTTAFFV